MCHNSIINEIYFQVLKVILLATISINICVYIYPYNGVKFYKISFLSLLNAINGYVLFFSIKSKLKKILRNMNEIAIDIGNSNINIVLF